MMYFDLFLSFLQIGLFSFGGGYAAMPLIQKQIVELHGWLSMDGFADLVTISEMTPGPIAINAATFVGIQVAGVPGALVATLGLVVPSCIVVSLLAWLYKRYQSLDLMQGILSGIRPAIVAMIASAGLGILLVAVWPAGLSMANLLQGIDYIAVGLFIVALVILRRWKPNPIWIIAGAGCLGAALHLAGLA